MQRKTLVGADALRPILIADSVGKTFRGRRILSAASLRAVPGDLRVLLGANGVGKSTLLKVAAGWIPPDSGALFFDGKVLSDPSPV